MSMNQSMGAEVKCIIDITTELINNRAFGPTIAPELTRFVFGTVKVGQNFKRYWGQFLVDVCTDSKSYDNAYVCFPVINTPNEQISKTWERLHKQLHEKALRPLLAKVRDILKSSPVSMKISELTPILGIPDDYSASQISPRKLMSDLIVFGSSYGFFETDRKRKGNYVKAGRDTPRMPRNSASISHLHRKQNEVCVNNALHMASKDVTSREAMPNDVARVIWAAKLPGLKYPYDFGVEVNGELRAVVEFYGEHHKWRLERICREEKNADLFGTLDRMKVEHAKRMDMTILCLTPENITGNLEWVKDIVEFVDNLR